jgi:hypothetical protein
MTRNAGGRQAGREIWPIVTMWLGLGVPDAEDGPAVRRGASFLLVQTLVVVVLGAALGAGWPWLTGNDVSRGAPAGLLVLALPLAAGIARTPPRLGIALAASVPAGVAVAAAVWWLAGAALDGFWLWFAALAGAALVAGPVFGALARDDARLGTPA